ncbi:DNA-binding response OmpR family regulator [Halarchaeum solikamskense]|uniref:HalX domain-containing protein n=1 Tax=Halarchaeum nitratireducens TaxID=489913 RepID=UPI001B3AC26B|nr:HalX domain-containing protein [Halarchaeum solikamskense]MBP2250799.1 DNA-binding response OmpR family regulator [Halarchaeum solikamskense]
MSSDDDPDHGADSDADERGPPTVLAVDDDQDLADTYAIWLRDDYDVRTAYDGESAMETIDESVDVVLLDRRMPDMSGGEVLESIRDAGYDVRVSMLTAVEPDVDIVDMGFDEYLVKPVTRQDVVNVVERLLARADYDDEVQEYFAVSEKIATLEAELSPEERADSDEYQRLERRKDELKDTVDEALMEVQDFEDAFREIEG